MFGATSFANAIKPKPFDGCNFKRWRELATLWLIAMNLMYVITGKAPEGVSEEKFNSDDNLFLGAIISILVDNLVALVSRKRRGRIFGRLMRLSMELLTPAVSCT
jgi:TctA family transporter